MERLMPIEKDYYLVGGDAWNSDEERYNSGGDDSSDDEVQKMMAKIAGVPRRKRNKKSLQLRPQGSDQATSQSKLEVEAFESSMEDELDCAFSAHQAEWMSGFSGAKEPSKKCVKFAETPGTSSTPAIEKEQNKKKQRKKQEEEDEVDPALGLKDIGTDSDEEFLSEEKMAKDANMPDFYDPQEDNDNQEWINQHRRSYGSKDETDENTGGMIKPRKLPNSDAVLNCPACMNLLSLDCQRHAIYKTQYRAMFVENCTVRTEETLHMPAGASKKSRKRAQMKTEPTHENVNAADMFHPVVCSICKTEIGVYDSDEVYHFFNVLSSYT